MRINFERYNYDGSVMSSEQVDKPILTDQQVLDAPEADYMNDAQLEFFRLKLLALHESTQARIREAKAQMSSPIAESDANDRASSEEQSSIALRIVEREQKLLPKIGQLREQIRQG